MNETKEQWLSRICDMHGLDEEDILMIAEMCLEDSETDLEFLKALNADGDISMGINKAHSIKGSAANVGFTTLSDAAKTVEQQLKNSDFGNLQENVNKISSALTEIKSVIG